MVKLQVFAIWVPLEENDRLETGRSEIRRFFDFVNEGSGDVRLCKSAADLAEQDVIKAVLAIEGGAGIDCRTELIEKVYDDGARILSLTWNEENEFASGCLHDGGLKQKGILAIHELNRLNMALDLSHINEQGFWESVDIFDGSPCATHSCVYDIMPCPRNLKRDQIESIINHDGYIGINFYPEFLKSRYATIGDILDHIEYVISCGGEDTVGLGSDFCGIQYTPDGLDSVADFQKIPEAMAGRGYSDSLISKICYGNLEKYILKFL